MKKKITSKKDLNNMALTNGAMVTDSSGRKFNSKKKTAVKQPPAIEPKRLEKAQPKPAVEPVKQIGPDEGSKLIADQMMANSRANLLMMAELKKQIAEIQFNAAEPVLEWKFDFERDSTTGYLTSISARAVAQKPTYN